MNGMSISNCKFQDAYITDSYVVYYNSSNDNNEIIINNSLFENIYESWNVFEIHSNGLDSSVSINGSIF
jgi:hypothetical protein